METERGKRSKEEVIDDLEKYLKDLEDSGFDLSLNSPEMRQRQVEKTKPRIEAIQKLRADSLARAPSRRIGHIALSI